MSSPIISVNECRMAACAALGIITSDAQLVHQFLRCLDFTTSSTSTIVDGKESKTSFITVKASGRYCYNRWESQLYNFIVPDDMDLFPDFSSIVDYFLVHLPEILHLSRLCEISNKSEITLRREQQAQGELDVFMDIIKLISTTDDIGIYEKQVRRFSSNRGQFVMFHASSGVVRITNEIYSNILNSVLSGVYSSDD